MMKYPKEYLDEIKLRLKVSQIVGKTVQLKKRGKEFIGLSPFTTEKTPSFTVSDEKGFYHCFSSGEHGNIFDFIMKTQSLKFGEAVKQLASEAGMQPFRFTNFDVEKEKRYQTYKNILKDYSDYHHKLIFSKDSFALDYLKKRGINKEIILEFNIGFVPGNSDYYSNLLKKFNEKEILETGLFYKSEKNNRFVNRFYSRIIFPIRNIAGDVIAFGGRTIKNSKIAKYINSPETEFYKKGKHIYNLDKARFNKNKDEKVIIVEGYMDVISVYSSGIKNVVSNSGTALTESQINLIWRFFSNPVICLDGDPSGQRAALRIAENLLPFIKENNKISFVTLKNDLDPDDYIKEKGKTQFEEFIKTGLSIEEFIWKIYLNDLDRSDPFAITKFEKKFRFLCQSIKDKTLQKYIFENFLEKIRNLTPLQKYSKKRELRNYKVLQETKKISVRREHLTKEEIKEYSILYIMCNYPDIISPRIEIFNDIQFSSKSLNSLKSEILNLIKSNNFDKNNILSSNNKYSSLIDDINQNSVIKNIFLKKKENQQVELLNEILKELNEIKFSKKIDKLEQKLIDNFDEKSYSDLIELKKQINKE
tara:strand:- start:2213 stop:3982 length:1770 start_codon:yes stop_codon:yes gene_type:complete